MYITYTMAIFPLLSVCLCAWNVQCLWPHNLSLWPLSMRSVRAYHGFYQVAVSVFRSVSLWLCRQQACLYAGYLCKVIKSIRVWLRPVRCGRDDKSASVNRLKLEGGAPDSARSVFISTWCLFQLLSNFCLSVSSRSSAENGTWRRSLRRCPCAKKCLFLLY